MFLFKKPPGIVLIDERSIDEYCPPAKHRIFFRGEIISYGEGDDSRIHLLLRGKIKITDCRENAEEDLVKDILVEPDIFGDLGLNGKIQNNECAEVLADNTLVYSFAVSDFKRIMKENPAMIFDYAAMVNEKLQRLETRHADLIYLDTKDRLISFIKNWARSDGNLVGDKIVLKNYLTHSDIAGFIDTSRQSVNMLLNELRTAGLLYYNRKHIELHQAIVWN